MLRRTRRVSDSAFTLVELLIVIAIIAVLVSIVVPALAKARNSSKQLACSSNHRQLITGWIAYTNDFQSFPYGADSSYRTRERFGWGGVHWYPISTPVPGVNIASDRPLNVYVVGEAALTSRISVFKCPLDVGAHLQVTGHRPWEQLYAGSASGEPGTCYGIAGTSYEANVWMYCRPGARDGWGSGLSAMTNYRAKQGFQDVSIDPSSFVVLKDIGPANWIVTSASMRSYTNLWGEWWHGSEQEMLSFLDGSARTEKSGLLVSSRYSMHMSRIRDANSTWRWPYQP